MLVRILADNPGKSFTRNIDAKFASTVKELLRDGRDMSVQQFLRETLDYFVASWPHDESLAGIISMWRKEKMKVSKRVSMAVCTSYLSNLTGKADPAKQQPPSRNFNPQPYNPNHQNYFARSHKPKGLPPPAELFQRVEEAKTSAKLLSQVVQSTPSSEVLGNELIKEFADRCQSASRSMQSYIHSDNPAPDEDTLLTLIETNDQLATAMSKHQRAILHARRVTGSISPSPQAQHGPFEVPSPGPLQPNGFRYPPSASGSGGGGAYTPPAGPPPNRQPPPEQMNPFADHNQAEASSPLPGNLQAPLVPQNYGLPPERVPVPTGDIEQPQPQTTKPRYRF